jgi:hypothetical protein
MGKVLEFGKERWAEKMKVIWYWPCLRIGMQTWSTSHNTGIAWKRSGSHHVRDTAGLCRRQQSSRGRMCQEEPELGPYMGTKSRCMV